MVGFIWGEMQWRVKDGFRILLHAADAVWIFGEGLKLSCIAVVPQSHQQPHLNLNLLEISDEGRPSVDNTTDREIAPELMHFGQSFRRILQAIWEACPAEDPVWVSKLNVTYTYHCGTLWPSQVSTFAYIAPLVPEDYCIIICINMFLPMGWVGSPKFFCAFSETLTGVANALVDIELLVPTYGSIVKIRTTRPGPPHMHESLTHIDCYMDDVISMVQYGLELQHRAFDGTVCSLK